MKNNTTECCAERRLINKLELIANKKGVKRHNMPSYIHRHFSKITIERYFNNQDPACCLPCLMCRQAISYYGLKFECFDQSGDIKKGFVEDIKTPAIVCLADKNRFYIKKN